MLYMGYVGFFKSPLPFAIAALLGGRLDAAWARCRAPGPSLGLAFLTAGLSRRLLVGPITSWVGAAGGSGPGRERVLHALVVGTALIHSLAVTEKTRRIQKLGRWLLAIATFRSDLLGTFLCAPGC